MSVPLSPRAAALLREWRIEARDKAARVLRQAESSDAAAWRALDDKARVSLLSYLVDDAIEYPKHRAANAAAIGLLLAALETADDHVSIPSAALAALVKATQYESDVRPEREIARHALHLDLLRHEPARHDAGAARAAAIVAPHDRYLHDGPRETCPLPSCATPDPPSPANPLDDLPEGERNRILDLAAEAHRKAFGFGDAASAAYDDVIRREVTAYHARDPRCPDSGCEHPDPPCTRTPKEP